MALNVDLVLEQRGGKELCQVGYGKTNEMSLPLFKLQLRIKVSYDIARCHQGGGGINS